MSRTDHPGRRIRAWSLYALTLAIATAGAAMQLAMWNEPVARTWDRLSGMSAVVGAVAFGFVGALVVATLPRHRVGWLLAAIGCLSALQLLVIGYGELATFSSRVALPAGPVALWVASWIWILYWGLIGVLFLTLPDGHVPSPRWRSVVLLMIVAVATTAAGTALQAANPDFPELANPIRLPESAVAVMPVVVALGYALYATAVLLSVLALALRFRRSIGIEREQLKWIVFSVLVVIAIEVAAGIPLGLIDPKAGDPGIIASVAQLLSFGAPALVAFGIGVAVMRFRLFDIDLIINRTLVYGGLTGSLAACYAVAVVVLQAILGPYTSGSVLEVALATLLVWSIGRPLRDRIQRYIDRSFYRSRYDAVRTVDAFAARLRDEVALDAIRRELLTAIDTTVQPTASTLWLVD